MPAAARRPLGMSVSFLFFYEIRFVKEKKLKRAPFTAHSSRGLQSAPAGSARERAALARRAPPPVLVFDDGDRQMRSGGGEDGAAPRASLTAPRFLSSTTTGGKLKSVAWGASPARHNRGVGVVEDSAVFDPREALTPPPF